MDGDHRSRAGGTYSGFPELCKRQGLRTNRLQKCEPGNVVLVDSSLLLEIDEKEQVFDVWNQGVSLIDSHGIFRSMRFMSPFKTFPGPIS